MNTAIPAEPLRKTAPPNPFAPRRYGELRKVTDRVYLFRNITNSSILIGDRSVAVVDTQVNLPSARRLLEAVRSVTDKPIEFVINTHYHWDHTNGNAVFAAEGAHLIASELTARFMSERQNRQKEFLSGRGFELGEDPMLPETIFRNELRIDLGDFPVRLFFAGRAETDDATAVSAERDNVVMSGDTVMTGSFPIFGQPVWDEGLQGDGEWQAAVRRILAMKPSAVLPGHGPLAGEAELELLIRIQDYFTAEVSRCLEKRMPFQALLADIEGRLPEWIARMPIVWGTPRYAILRVYRGLTRSPADSEPGWQRFKPSVFPAADPSALDRTVLGRRTEEDFLNAAKEAREGGDEGLALGVLRRCAEVFPDSGRGLCALAETLVELSRREESVLEKGDFFSAARTAWNRALAINPDDARALLGKGRYFAMMAYRGGDDPGRGVRLLERVLELAPGPKEEAEAHFYIGMAFRSLGNETEARARFHAALERNPSFMPAVLAGAPSP